MFNKVRIDTSYYRQHCSPAKNCVHHSSLWITLFGSHMHDFSFSYTFYLLFARFGTIFLVDIIKNVLPSFLLLLLLLFLLFSHIPNPYYLCRVEKENYFIRQRAKSYRTCIERKKNITERSYQIGYRTFVTMNDNACSSNFSRKSSYLSWLCVDKSFVEEDTVE